MVVTPDDETFNTNYGSPEFIFSSLEQKPFILSEVFLDSSINRVNKGYPVSEGLIFTGDSLEEMIQAKHFNRFKKQDYEKWLQKKDSKVEDSEPIAYIDLQAEPKAKFPVLQKQSPKRYIKFVPTSFRKKPINYASQAVFDKNGSEFIFFAAFGKVVEE